MWMPYQMQLAHGWTSLSIRINLVAVAVIIPAILWVVPIYGAIGAAWIWVVLNTGYCVIEVHFMFRRILVGEKWAWYWNDVLIPLVASVLSALLIRGVLHEKFDRLGEFVVVIGSSITIVSIAALFAPMLRRRMLNYLRNRIRPNCQV